MPDTSHHRPPFTIGITGGSASGKTYFMQQLIERFGEAQICRISQDNYYLPVDTIPRDKNGVENFDLPETIDHVLFAAHLAALRKGNPVRQQEYTFNNPLLTPKMLRFEPRPVLIVEGIFLYYFEEVARQIDLKIFIDAREHIKIKRRISRDALERGYDLDDVLYRWEHHVAPTYEKYVRPLREEADIVINNNRRMDTGLDVISALIREKLSPGHGAGTLPA